MRPTSQQPTTSRAALDAIRVVTASRPPLPGLDPDTYARDHALFEARSDQRALITDFLVDRLTGRGGGPVSVLSVGCGDGTVDAAVARALLDTAPGRAVRYVGVEPFSGSATAFAGRMAAIGSSALDAEVVTSTFDDAGLVERFDVVVFVHSMYYVPDVASTLRRAHDLLRPGGELIVLSAPRGELNQLTVALAPPVAGHRQWFSDDVADGFLLAGVGPVTTTSIDARVDLTGADDDVLDFTVQARLDDVVRPLVLDHLADVSVDDGVVVRHPVDVYRVPR
ncbi:MAG: class I SAM-dependent methyltransferase [Nocardioidaceae bacterium]|nr:class I SAM-dependent methyltransferase [Nocardioidaceae bacterium]